MEYNFREIEKKWQAAWASEKVYEVPNQSDKPKYYVLDMFPYPSGAGLHVGHPLGYIASDIYARYKRLKGFNVLHPMGYDAFGLPAEQYALEHGVHPAVSTAQNIKNFRAQLDKIGFSFDWSREVNTSDPKYYKWTQWIFLQLFNSWFNRRTQKAEPVHGLLKKFETEGNQHHPIPNTTFLIPHTGKNVFSADEWKSFDAKTQADIVMEYRLAYCGYGEVNWCEALGTVLANDEVVNGVSERGGHPVVKKTLRQWYLRITEYADRLLEGLQRVDFSEAMKEMQTNWIGRSSGAEVVFRLTPRPPLQQVGEGEGSTSVEEAFPKYKVDNRLQFDHARNNRRQSTGAEDLLWQQLRNNKTGYKFRRQHPVENFIVDFVCLEKGLAIEVDGGYHDDLEQKQQDAARTQILHEKGFEVIRFTNHEVQSNVYAVRDKIKAHLNNNSSHQLHEPQSNYVTSPLSSFAGEGQGLRCYTTRPDTIFGVDFLVLAPEHELVEKITTPEQKQAVDDYIAYVNSRSERERMAEKKISGVATGAYAEHPFTGLPIPIWIAEYVLAGYGTGAIMAVPAGDERDHRFAQHFGIPITNIFGEAYTGAEAITAKEVTLYNSDFLDGLQPTEAIERAIEALEKEGVGTRKVNYKMRDAAFSRQRYWGEPFPIVWKDGIAVALDEKDLPLELPHVEKYGPGPDGEGPLANLHEWTAQGLETNTMPGYAGSSWYFLRYMDPHNNQTFCDPHAAAYWNQVDLYVGGTEHAVGHLLYSRMWTKALHDLGFIPFDEPFKKLLNQGMIAGLSYFADDVRFLRSVDDKNTWVVRANLPYYVSSGKGNTISEQSEITIAADDLNPITIYKPTGEVRPARFRNVENFVDSRGRLYEKRFAEYTRNEFQFTADISYLGILWEKDEAGEEYIQLDQQVEKMSKSKYNTVNPDDIVEKYGADTFRMYEMFLGPVEASKPWDTKGIEGVHRFLKKLWRLFYNEDQWRVTDEKPTAQELKTLHKTIKKIEEDTERFSFNTAVSAFMVCVNELTDAGCHKREILEPLLILLTPYAPHIAEELYQQLHQRADQLFQNTILDAPFPEANEAYLKESSKEYPVSVNGKMRTQINLPLDATQQEVEQQVLANDIVQKWMEGKPLKKFIFVPGKMVNIVI